MRLLDPANLPQCGFRTTIAGREWVCTNPVHTDEPNKHWLVSVKPQPAEQDES
jgi:hypothetical protein